MSTRTRWKDWIIDAVVIVFAAAAVAAGLVMFTVPNDIAPGGVSGLATALTQLTGGISVGLWTLIINVPLIVVAWIRFGITPLVKTIAATLLLSLLIDVFTPILPTYTNNPLLAAGLGGALMGAGMGALFVRGGTTGGTDLLSMLLKRVFPNVSMGQLLLCVDAAVVVFAVCVFKNIEVALYSFVTIFVTTKVIDGIMQGVDYAKVIYVVTERGAEIIEKLALEMGRGVTVLPARGGFTGREKQMLMVITHRGEFAQTLGIVKAADREAFIFVMNATEVHGEGFKPM